MKLDWRLFNLCYDSCKILIDNLIEISYQLKCWFCGHRIFESISPYLFSSLRGKYTKNKCECHCRDFKVIYTLYKDWQTHAWMSFVCIFIFKYSYRKNAFSVNSKICIKDLNQTNAFAFSDRVNLDLFDFSHWRFYKQEPYFYCV